MLRFYLRSRLHLAEALEGPDSHIRRLIGDKGYDGDRLRKGLHARSTVPTISATSLGQTQI
ncbi:hypothetical protein PMNALOAF_4320 [Methylobacterium adhaesivum]|nr:hypothetical protein PMNALOAF_4320 [Methylobacterium adhaesivum]